VKDVLNAIWREPRPPAAPGRVWRDWALVAILIPLAVLEGVLRPDLPWRVAWVIIAIALTPTLLWRRTAPLVMVGIAFGVTALAPLLIAAPRSYTIAYLLILPYALYRWGSGREIVLGSAILLAKVGISLAFGWLGAGNAIGGFAVLSASVALGAAFRYRAGSRARELDRVKERERERLARDLHDTVAHHVSAMAIRAQAGIAVSATRPDAAVDALHVIEAEASRALAEMRAMVRVLRRDEPASMTPNPQITDLARLAEGSGVPVDVAVSGNLDDLPPSVGAAIYRLAQESVTNARRHARHATRVEVRVAADATAVHLRVSDDGDTGTSRTTTTTGYGLIGMIERADLLGGVCAAGPNPGRGWTVTATLPRTGAAA
jgi:signal transduction histidine kinase